MRLRFLLSGLLVVCFLAGTIYSQPKPPSKREILRHLKTRLELTDEQAMKVDEILSTSEKQLKSLKEKMDEQREDMMDEIDSIIDS